MIAEQASQKVIQGWPAPKLVAGTVEQDVMAGTVTNANPGFRAS